MHAPDSKSDALRIEGDGALVIDWNDGHQTAIRLERLRRACPCAVCRETREREEGKPELPPESTRVRRLERVGRYAVSVVWGDGHDTGIFSWPILRNLCDCFQCRLDRGEL